VPAINEFEPVHPIVDQPGNVRGLQVVEGYNYNGPSAILMNVFCKPGCEI
jgi:hypothetical protein